MADINKVIEGLQILNVLYRTKELGVDAHHDSLFVGPIEADATISTEILARLDELGWGYDESEQSWVKYV